MSELVRLRETLKPRAAAAGVKLTYLPFIIRAVVKGLHAFPTLNGTLDENAGEILVRRYVNMGIAVQTEMGLIVPVIRDADLRGTFDLARELDRQAGKIGKKQNVLIDVNIAGEEQKAGVTVSNAAVLVREAAKLRNIRIRGLMTMPPYAEDPGGSARAS